ncbi:MAG: aldolase, partial [Gordonia amarae]
MTAAGTPRTLADSVRGRIDDLLAPVDADLAARFPGDDPSGQPAHTVYV